MSAVALNLKSSVVKILSVAVTTVLVGCGGSELVDISLPTAIQAGQPFEVTVDHVLNEDYEVVGTDHGSLVFAAIVPDTWSATGASYEGTAGGSPYSSAVSISDAPPETSEEVIDELAGELGGSGDVLCGATVAVREGPLPSDPLIATLFSSAAETAYSPQSADPFSLAAYAGGSVYVVADVASCAGPSGLLVDALVLDAGSGNELSNSSFESDLTGWDTSASGPDCVNEVLEEGDITAGAGGWEVPAVGDGSSLYASDANFIGECVISQMVTVPGGAGAATFTGVIGVNAPVEFVFFLDVNIPDPGEGNHIIWFRTADIPLYTSLIDGDTGQLSVTFVASEESEDEQEVVFAHGQYGEVEEPELAIMVAEMSAPLLRRLAPSAGGAPIAEPVIAPLATPGFIGAGTWFMEDTGPDGDIQIIDSALLVLPAEATEVPALSGFMLLILSVVIGALGLNRRRLKK